MKLKPDINIAAFLQTIQACSDDVYFATSEGDTLNLKSALSRLVFTAVLAEKLQEIDGCVTVQNTDDAALMYPYCM